MSASAITLLHATVTPKTWVGSRCRCVLRDMVHESATSVEQQVYRTTVYRSSSQRWRPTQLAGPAVKSTASSTLAIQQCLRRGRTLRICSRQDGDSIGQVHALASLRIPPSNCLYDITTVQCLNRNTTRYVCFFFITRAYDEFVYILN